MTDEEKDKIIRDCYEATDTDIPPEVFIVMLNCLDASGYALNRTGAWNQPVIDLTPIRASSYVIREEYLPMVV